MSVEAPWLDASEVEDSEPWKTAPVVSNVTEPWREAPEVKPAPSLDSILAEADYQRGEAAAKDARASLDTAGRFPIDPNLFSGLSPAQAQQVPGAYDLADYQDYKAKAAQDFEKAKAEDRALAAQATWGNQAGNAFKVGGAAINRATVMAGKAALDWGNGGANKFSTYSDQQLKEHEEHLRALQTKFISEGKIKEIHTPSIFGDGEEYTTYEIPSPNIDYNQLDTDMPPPEKGLDPNQVVRDLDLIRNYRKIRGTGLDPNVIQSAVAPGGPNDAMYGVRPELADTWSGSVGRFAGQAAGFLAQNYALPGLGEASMILSMSSEARAEAEQKARAGGEEDPDKIYEAGQAGAARGATEGAAMAILFHGVGEASATGTEALAARNAYFAGTGARTATSLGLNTAGNILATGAINKLDGALGGEDKPFLPQSLGELGPQVAFALLGAKGEFSKSRALASEAELNQIRGLVARVPDEHLLRAATDPEYLRSWGYNPKILHAEIQRRGLLGHATEPSLLAASPGDSETTATTKAVNNALLNTRQGPANLADPANLTFPHSASGSDTGSTLPLVLSPAPINQALSAWHEPHFQGQIEGGLNALLSAVAEPHPAAPTGQASSAPAVSQTVTAVIEHAPLESLHVALDHPEIAQHLPAQVQTAIHNELVERAAAPIRPAVEGEWRDPLLDHLENLEARPPRSVAATSASSTPPAPVDPTRPLTASETPGEVANSGAPTKANATPPVAPIKITGKEFGDGLPFPELRKRAGDFLKSLRGKTYVNRETGHEILVDKTGTKEAVSGRRVPEKLTLAKRLPELIENSTYAGPAKDYKHHAGILHFHYYDTPIEVNGRLDNARVVVRELPDGKRFYDHYFLSSKTGVKSEPAAKSGPSPEEINPQALGDPQAAGSGNEVTSESPTGNPESTFDRGKGGELTPSEAAAIDKADPANRENEAQQAFRRDLADPEKVVALARRKSDGMIVLSADDFTAASPDMQAAKKIADPNLSFETGQRVYDGLRKTTGTAVGKAFDHLLAQPGDGEVVFTVGGPGSGKSTYINIVKNADFIVDAVQADGKLLSDRIQAVLNSGRQARVVFIDRDVREAMSGNLKRALTEKRASTAAGLSELHAKARTSFLTAKEQFQSNPDVVFKAYESGTLKPTEVKPISVDEARTKAHNTVYEIITGTHPEWQGQPLPAAIARRARGAGEKMGSGNGRGAGDPSGGVSGSETPGRAAP